MQRANWARAGASRDSAQRLNRKRGVLNDATDPAPPKRIEEMEKEGWRGRGTLTVSPEFPIDASLGSLVTNGFGALQGMNFLFHEHLPTQALNVVATLRFLKHTALPSLWPLHLTSPPPGTPDFPPFDGWLAPPHRSHPSLNITS